MVCRPVGMVGFSHFRYNICNVISMYDLTCFEINTANLFKLDIIQTIRWNSFIPAAPIYAD